MQPASFLQSLQTEIIGKYTENFSRLEDQLTHVKSDVDNFSQSHNSQLKELQNEYSNSQKQLLDYQKQVQALHQQIVDLQKTQKETISNQVKLAIKKHQTKEKEEQAEYEKKLSKQELLQKEKEMKLKEEIRTITTTNFQNDTKNQLNSYSQKLMERDLQIKQYRQQANDSKTKIDQKTNELKKIQHEINQAKIEKDNQTKREQQDLQSQQNQIKEYQARLLELKKSKANGVNHTKELQKQLVDSQRKEKDVALEQARLQSETQTLIMKAAIETEQAMKNQISESKKKIDLLKNEDRTKTVDLAKLKRENEAQEALVAKFKEEARKKVEAEEAKRMLEQAKKAQARGVSEVMKNAQKNNLVPKSMPKVFEIDNQKTYNEKTKDFVQKIIAAGQIYSDPEFKPELSSLISASECSDQEVFKMKQIEWKRSAELFKSSPVQIFPKDMKSTGVKQGKLANESLGVVINCLSENLKLVQDTIFETSKSNKAGLYLLKLYVDGKQTAVAVDDHFPVSKQTKQQCFLSCQGKPETELWICLIEKALAKVLGSYAATEALLPNQAAQYLMGVPTFTQEHCDVLENCNFDEFWQKLVKYSNQNYKIFVSASGSKNICKNKPSYFIQQVCEVRHPDSGKKLRLIKFKGTNETWEGNWSQNSSLWNSELRSQLKYESQLDLSSYFFMSLEDYLQQFECTSFCYSFENAHKQMRNNVTYQIDSENINKPVFFKFKLEQEIDLKKDVFCISAQEQKNDNQTKSKPIRFNIVLIMDATQNKPATYIQGHTSEYANSSNCLLVDDAGHQGSTLIKGTYSLIIDPIWNSKQESCTKQYVEVYCSQKVILEPTIDSQIQKTFEECALINARSNICQKSYYMAKDPSFGILLSRVTSLDALGCWFGYMYYKNDTAYDLKQTLTIKAEGIEILGKKLTNKNQGEYVYELNLHAQGGEDIIFVKKIRQNYQLQVQAEIDYQDTIDANDQKNATILKRAFVSYEEFQRQLNSIKENARNKRAQSFETRYQLSSETILKMFAQKNKDQLQQLDYSDVEKTIVVDKVQKDSHNNTRKPISMSVPKAKESNNGTEDTDRIEVVKAASAHIGAAISGPNSINDNSITIINQELPRKLEETKKNEKDSLDVKSVNDAKKSDKDSLDAKSINQTIKSEKESNQVKPKIETMNNQKESLKAKSANESKTDTAQAKPVIETKKDTVQTKPQNKNK